MEVPFPERRIAEYRSEAENQIRNLKSNETSSVITESTPSPRGSGGKDSGGDDVAVTTSTKSPRGSNAGTGGGTRNGGNPTTDTFSTPLPTTGNSNQHKTDKDTTVVETSPSAVGLTAEQIEDIAEMEEKTEELEKSGSKVMNQDDDDDVKEELEEHEGAETETKEEGLEVDEETKKVEVKKDTEKESEAKAAEEENEDEEEGVVEEKAVHETPSEIEQEEEEEEQEEEKEALDEANLVDKESRSSSQSSTTTLAPKINKEEEETPPKNEEPSKEGAKKPTEEKQEEEEAFHIEDVPDKTTQPPKVDPDAADEEVLAEIEAELHHEEKVARGVGSLGFFLAIGAMIFTAHQMSENPDGFFARYVVFSCCDTVLALATR
jgi:hypothetical protein